MDCCNNNCHNIPRLPEYDSQDSAIALMMKVYRYAKQLGDILSGLNLDVDDDIKKLFEEISRLDGRIDQLPNLIEKCQCIVDSTITQLGKNPVSGGAIYDALEKIRKEMKELDVNCNCVTDDALSETSDNAVKNKVIALAIKNIKDDIAKIGTGVSIKILTVYRISATKPSKPTGGKYNFTTKSFQTPDDWFESVTSKDGDTVWICLGTAYSNSDTIEWQDPFSNSAGTGSSSGPGNVVSARVPIIYKSSTTKPAIPTGGTYNFTADTFTAPNGWKKDKSSFTDNDVVWMSIGSATSDDTEIKWSDPIRISGGSGSSILKRAKILTIYTASTENPGIPSGGSYDFTSEILTPPDDWQTDDNFPDGSVVWMSIGSVYEGSDTIDWSKPIRISGGAGSSVVKRTRILSVYKANPTRPNTPSGGSYNFSNNTLTPPTGWTEDSSKFEDGDIVWLSIGSLIEGDVTINWSKPLRITPGVGSANITTAFVAIVYKESSTKPSTPTGGSYNFDTKALTAPSGWTKDALSGDNAWFSARVFYKNGTETAWSEPQPAASADVTLTAANLEVIAQSIKLTSNELDIIASKVNLDSEQLQIIAVNVQLTTDELAVIADNIDVSAINLDVLAQKINLTTQELNTIASKVTLNSNQLDVIASKVNLDAEDLKIVAENVDLTTDQLRVIADNVDITTIDYSVLANRITLTSNELGIVASKVQLTANDITAIAKKVSLDTSDLAVVAENVHFTTDDLQVVADKISLSTAELNTIAQNVNLTTANLNTIAKNVTLSTENLKTIANNVTLSTTNLDVIASKVSLSSDQLAVVANNVTLTTANLTTIANNVKLTADNLDAIAKKVTLTTDQLKIIAGNATVSVSDSQIISAISNSTGAASAIIQAVNKGTSSIKLSADKIELDGEVLANAISAKSLDLWSEIQAGSVKVKVIGVHLQGDGSGYLANNKINWTKEGVLNVAGWVINSTSIVGGNTSLWKTGEISNINGSTIYWKLGADGSGSLGRETIRWTSSGELNIYGNVNIDATSCKISTLCLGTATVPDTSMNSMYTYTGSSNSNYWLPTNPETGMILCLSSRGGSLTVQGNGNSIYYKETSASSVNIGKKPCFLWFDGSAWHAIFDNW